MKKLQKILTVAIACILSFGCFGCKNKAGTDRDDSSGVFQTETTFSDIDLVKDGQSEYKILIPAEAHQYEAYAGQELQYFFAMATGVILPILSDVGTHSNSEKIISLGNTSLKEAEKIDASDLDLHGYVITDKNQAILIVGQDEKGTLNGVYEYLERQFNFHYYANDEIAIDKTMNCKLLEGKYQNAPFFPDYNIGFSGSVGLFETNMRYRANENRFSTKGWPHSHFSWINPNTYYDAHPSWFSGDKKALCLTNKEMMDEMVNVLIQKAEEDPTIIRFMLGAEDDWARCTCETCEAERAKYTHSGVDIIFANYVSSQVNEYFKPQNRRIEFVTLNYYHTQQPPVNFEEATQTYVPIDPLVVPNEYIYLQVCFTSADHGAALMDKERNSSSVQILEGWTALTDKLTVYLYHGWDVHPALLFFDDFSYLSTDVKALKEYGCEYIVFEGSPTRVGTFEPLRAYLVKELYWNPKQDQNILIEDFIENYYKAGAPYVQEYFDRLRLHIAQTRKMYEAENSSFVMSTMWTGLNKYWYEERTWPQRFLEQNVVLLEKAIQAVKEGGYDNETYDKLIYRLRIEALSPKYLLLKIYKSTYSTNEYIRLMKEFNEEATELGASVVLD